MERDRLTQQEGDLHRDLEEKEGADTFEPIPSIESGPNQAAHPDAAATGDRRPGDTGSEEAHFVDAQEDPNLHISRRSSDLIPPPNRQGAEELAKIRHDDSSVYAKPQGPIQKEGGAIGPRQPEGDDS